MNDDICPKCDAPLMISNSRYASEEGSTDVYVELKMVCVNPKCNNFSGRDLNNSKIIVKTIKNKI